MTPTLSALQWISLIIKLAPHVRQLARLAKARLVDVVRGLIDLANVVEEHYEGLTGKSEEKFEEFIGLVNGMFARADAVAGTVAANPGVFDDLKAAATTISGLFHAWGFWKKAK